MRKRKLSKLTTGAWTAPHNLSAAIATPVSRLFPSSKWPGRVVAFAVPAAWKGMGFCESPVPTGPPTGIAFKALTAPTGADPPPARRISKCAGSSSSEASATVAFCNRHLFFTPSWFRHVLQSLNVAHVTPTKISWIEKA